jgi:hypothetical protein
VDLGGCAGEDQRGGRGNILLVSGWKRKG